jgi:hypothetical protein
MLPYFINSIFGAEIKSHVGHTWLTWSEQSMIFSGPWFGELQHNCDVSDRVWWVLLCVHYMLSCSGKSLVVWRHSMLGREQLNAQQDAFWLNYKRFFWSDRIPEAVKTLVSDWWVQETSISPNWKDVVRRRIGVKDFVHHPTHYLQTLEVRIYTLCTSFQFMSTWFGLNLEVWPFGIYFDFNIAYAFVYTNSWVLAALHHPKYLLLQVLNAYFYFQKDSINLSAYMCFYKD